MTKSKKYLKKQRYRIEPTGNTTGKDVQFNLSTNDLGQDYQLIDIAKTELVFKVHSDTLDTSSQSFKEQLKAQLITGISLS